MENLWELAGVLLGFAAFMYIVVKIYQAFFHAIL